MPVPSVVVFRRRQDERVLSGVAGGFAVTHGIDPFVVRAALVVLSLAGGIGIAVYLVGLVFAGAPLLNEAGHEPPPRPIDALRNLAVGCVAGGLLLAMRGFGAWPGDTLMVPVIGIGGGLAIFGASSGEAVAARRGPWGPIPAGRLAAIVGGRHAKWRTMVGAGLTIAGLASFGAGGGGVASVVRSGVLGALLALTGVFLAVGPWLARVGLQIGEERRERIRSEERAAMATHLHDSVLQTLALIQRNAADPRRTVTLARRQERELRDWLYGGASRSGRSATHPLQPSLARGAAQLAEEVEELHDVRVELVVVGDHGADDGTDALLAAAREAAVNAAKHAGVEEVSVYVEAAADGLHAFVRDRGTGFDPAAVPADRRGLAESITARMARVGGRAEIDSAPGAGTEVRLFLPSQPPFPDEAA